LQIHFRRAPERLADSLRRRSIRRPCGGTASSSEALAIVQKRSVRGTTHLVQVLSIPHRRRPKIGCSRPGVTARFGEQIASSTPDGVPAFASRGDSGSLPPPHGVESHFRCVPGGGAVLATGYFLPARQAEAPKRLHETGVWHRFYLETGVWHRFYPVFTYVQGRGARPRCHAPCAVRLVRSRYLAHCAGLWCHAPCAVPASPWQGRGATHLALSA
jgi:hypothetical protein